MSTNNIMSEKYTVEIKSSTINKFLEIINPIENTLMSRLKMMRNQAIEECNEEKYIQTITVEKEFRRCKITTIDSIYNSTGLDDAISKIDAFVNAWMYCDTTKNSCNCCCKNK